MLKKHSSMGTNWFWLKTICDLIMPIDYPMGELWKY